MSTLQFAGHELCYRSLCPVVYTIVRGDGDSVQLQPVSHVWTALVPPIVIDFTVCVFIVTDSTADDGELLLVYAELYYN